MPYCPSCGYEFVQEKTRCPDCDEPLQANPPEELPAESWVVLKHISMKGEGRVLRDLLISNDIPAVVEDASFDMMPATSEDLIRIRVLVKEKDLERARQLLESAPLDEDMMEDTPSEN